MGTTVQQRQLRCKALEGLPRPPQEVHIVSLDAYLDEIDTRKPMLRDKGIDRRHRNPDGIPTHAVPIEEGIALRIRRVHKQLDLRDCVAQPLLKRINVGIQLGGLHQVIEGGRRGFKGIDLTGSLGGCIGGKVPNPASGIDDDIAGKDFDIQPISHISIGRFAPEQGCPMASFYRRLIPAIGNL